MRKLLYISLIFLSFTSCNTKSTEDQVAEWISENAIPITTVAAGNGFEDLSPFGEIIGDSRIVSLGEPTHGNSEVFQLKHRFIEYLVTEKGFNLFALECPFGEAFDVNQYILDGIGTPEEALAGIYYWTWDTKEVVELLNWMRSYNADPSHLIKVKFYGFDTQDPVRAARFMLEYLEKVDPELAQEVLPELNILQIPFSEPKSMGRRPYIPQEYDEASHLAIKQVMKAFEDNRDNYKTILGVESYSLAKQHARQAEIWIESCMNDSENYDSLRDKGMAENIQWILDYEGDEAKAILWAHNCHVSNAAPKETDMMGKHLKKMVGDELKIFGMFFNQGGFKALDVDSPSKGIQSFIVGTAPQGTLEYAMASAKLPLVAVDMHQLPENGPVYDWFHTQLPTRHSGAGYSVAKPQNYFWSYKPAEAYDVLVFLDATSPVNYINESDFDDIWLNDKHLEKPLNLDFENNHSGEIPNDWLTWSKFQRLGVQFEVSDDHPYQGKNSALIYRPEGVTFGELTPNLTQAINAKPYRGKKIKISAATRAEIAEPVFAFFRVKIEPDILQSAHDGSPPLFDTLDQFRIKSSEWKILQVEAEVHEEAHTINYGIYLRDFGKVWLDAVYIEVVD